MRSLLSYHLMNPGWLGFGMVTLTGQVQRRPRIRWLSQLKIGDAGQPKSKVLARWKKIIKSKFRVCKVRVTTA